MPRNLRNFWVEVVCDGYAKSVGMGPRSKDGSMEIVLRVRSLGEAITATYIRCIPSGEHNVIYIDGEEVWRGKR